MARLVDATPVSFAARAEVLAEIQSVSRISPILAGCQPHFIDRRTTRNRGSEVPFPPEHTQAGDRRGKHTRDTDKDKRAGRRLPAEEPLAERTSLRIAARGGDGDDDGRVRDVPR